jgi:hypothetical protein
VAPRVGVASADDAAAVRERFVVGQFSGVGVALEAWHDAGFVTPDFSNMIVYQLHIGV